MLASPPDVDIDFDQVGARDSRTKREKRGYFESVLSPFPPLTPFEQTDKAHRPLIHASTERSIKGKILTWVQCYAS